VFRAEVLSKIKLGRVGTVEDVSVLMTGSALMLDGGWTAG